MIYVTKDFFQSSVIEIPSGSVEADVLGFFSLILTYAKGASSLDGEQSPKHIGSIMPRTDFTTIFAQVKSRVPGTLYRTVTYLACHINSGNTVVIDTNFCTGTVSEPQPNEKMDKQAFEYDPESSTPDSCTVDEWMTSIQNGVLPDALTTFDINFNGQVGGLGPALENVLDTTRAVPLFEFRRLPGVTQPGMESFVEKAEQAIITYHKANPAPPRLIKRRPEGRYNHIKRHGASAACVATPITAATSQTTALPQTSTAPTTTGPSPAPTPPAPVCSAGFYGTDTSCGGKCHGPKANCECMEAGYELFNEACTCTC